MNRRLSILAVILSGVMAWGSMAHAALEMETTDEFNFEGSAVENGDVRLQWIPFVPEDFVKFNLYRDLNRDNLESLNAKLLETNESRNFGSFVDKAVGDGEYLYRLCAQTNTKNICSEIISVSIKTTEEAVEAEEPTVVVQKPVQFTFQGLELDGKVKLLWTVNESFDGGFQILRSTSNQSLEYPVKEGDVSFFLSDSNIRSYDDAVVTVGQDYYYRVCQFVDLKCISYSDPVKISVSGGDDVNLKKNIVTYSFPDIEGNPYANAIEYVKKEGIVQGYPDGHYRPGKRINRAEFTKILIGANFEKIEISTCMKEGDVLFKDVPNDQWFTPFVCMAKKKGVIQGYPDGTFKPNAEINFAEAAKIVSRVSNLSLGAETGQWYERYVRALQAEKAVPPSITSVNHYINRGEMAEMIWRVREKITDQTSKMLLK